MTGWCWNFRDEFGKSGQDQTRSGFPKFMTENGWLMLDFPGRIWEIWTGSDTIRISQICDRKWLADAGFSGTNLGNLDRIRHDQDFPNSWRKMAGWTWWTGLWACLPDHVWSCTVLQIRYAGKGREEEEAQNIILLFRWVWKENTLNTEKFWEIHYFSLVRISVVRLISDHAALSRPVFPDILRNQLHSRSASYQMPLDY